jgi:hypothetical protein
LRQADQLPNIADIESLRSGDTQRFILDRLKQSIKALVTESFSSDQPITNANPHTQKLLFIVQTLLKHGLKGMYPSCFSLP